MVVFWGAHAPSRPAQGPSRELPMDDSGEAPESTRGARVLPTAVLTFAAASRTPCGMQRTLFALVAGLLFAADTFAAKPPNIVLIISDDQAWGDYSFMGHEAIETPNIDRLAKQSRLFKRGYVPTSLCCPSLATMITGLFPHQHGITGNEPPIPAAGKKSAEYRSQVQECVGFIDSVPTLPRLLAGMNQEHR